MPLDIRRESLHQLQGDQTSEDLLHLESKDLSAEIFDSTSDAHPELTSDSADREVSTEIVFAQRKQFESITACVAVTDGGLTVETVESTQPTLQRTASGGLHLFYHLKNEDEHHEVELIMPYAGQPVETETLSFYQTTTAVVAQDAAVASTSRSPSRGPSPIEVSRYQCLSHGTSSYP